MRNRSCGLSSQKGFSLLEVMIATVLLATVSIGLLSIFASSRKVLDPERNIAHNSVRDKLAALYIEVKDSTWNNASNLLYPTSSSGVTTSESLNNVNYQSTKTVASVDADGDGQEDYRKVQVANSWTS